MTHYKIYSLSAVAVGYLLSEDLNANDQNAVANWLMLVAQFLSTNSFLQEIETNKNNNTSLDDLSLLKKLRIALDKEIKNMEQDNS